MTPDDVAMVARAVAERLSVEHDPALTAEVEAALHQRPDAPPDRYIDPTAVATLIVAIATLAWSVYTDLKKSASPPPATVVARHVRLRWQQTHTVDETTTRIIDLTVPEVAKHDAD